MKNQHYGNHVRMYPAHHFIFYPLTIFALGISIRQAISASDDVFLWIMISLLWAAVIWLSYMTRQHYALTCQDRIVRLELRFRYYILTGERMDLLETELSITQIAALRFASDEELPALVKRTIKEKLPADQIMRSIKNWIPDHMRV